MPHLKQFSFIINQRDFTVGPHVSRFKIHTHPFQHPKDLIGIVNQNEVLKIHGIVDQNEPKVDHEFLLVGTGATVPDDLIDRLFRVGTVLLGEGLYGYHAYILQDPRGIPEGASDKGLTPKFKVALKLDDQALHDQLAETVAKIEEFCEQHKGVVRYHPECGEEGYVEVHGYSHAFRQDQDFHNFMGAMYSSPVVDDVVLSKSV